MKIKVKDLTIGEVEDWEDIAGRPFFDVFSPSGTRYMRDIRALLFIVKRRDDPTLTVDDVKNLTLTEMTEVEIDWEADPTNGSEPEPSLPSADSGESPPRKSGPSRSPKSRSSPR